MLGVFHVLAVISRRAFDQRRGIKHTEPTLPECLRLADHLAVKVRMKSITSTIPWHHEDDVPNVGTSRQLNEVVQGGEMGIDPFLHEIVCCVPALL